MGGNKRIGPSRPWTQNTEGCKKGREDSTFLMKRGEGGWLEQKEDMERRLETNPSKAPNS